MQKHLYRKVGIIAVAVIAVIVVIVVVAAMNDSLEEDGIELSIDSAKYVELLTTVKAGYMERNNLSNIILINIGHSWYMNPASISYLLAFPSFDT